MSSTRIMMNTRQPWFALMLIALVSCRSPSKKTGGAAMGSVQNASSVDKQEVEKQESVSDAAEGSTTEGSAAEAAPPPPPKPFSDQVDEDSTEYTELTTRWGPSDLVDLGPAASVSATPSGPVFITRDDQVLLAKHSFETEFIPVNLPAEAFSKYGWGPSVSPTHVYWVSRRGLLMRASLRDLKAEALFDHARPATRTSVQTAARRDVVAFIADIDQHSYAYIWASSGAGAPEILDASADGHQATSVSLVEGRPHPRLIVLEGRTSMSPVHSRIVRVTPRRVVLDYNEVVWIGPGSHELTEIHAIGVSPGEAIAFLTTQKDFNDFGLAQLRISERGGESDEPKWQIFPNGLDPAPLATGHFCGGDFVLFVRPSEKRPHAPQELHIARLEGNQPKEGDVLVRSRAFNDVSVAAIKDGAILVWTADRRSWGMRLRCPKNNTASRNP